MTETVTLVVMKDRNCFSTQNESWRVFGVFPVMWKDEEKENVAKHGVFFFVSNNIYEIVIFPPLSTDNTVKLMTPVFLSCGQLGVKNTSPFGER